MKFWHTDKLADLNNKLHRGSKYCVLDIGEVPAFDMVAPQDVAYTCKETINGGSGVVFKVMDERPDFVRIFPSMYDFSCSEVVAPRLTYNVRTSAQVVAMKSILGPRLDKIEDNLYKQCLRHGRYIYRLYRHGEIGPILIATPNFPDGNTTWGMYEKFGIIVSRKKLKIKGQS